MISAESMTTRRRTTGRHINSGTAIFHRQPTRRHDHWPTGQVTDNFFSYKNRQHSPTEPFLEKGLKVKLTFGQLSVGELAHNGSASDFQWWCLSVQGAPNFQSVTLHVVSVSNHYLSFINKVEWLSCEPNNQLNGWNHFRN